MRNWIDFSNQNLPVSLEYPNLTPQGYPVKIQEGSTEASFRAHFMSEGSNEVYFEVGQYRDVNTQEAIEAFLEDVTARFDQLEVGDLEKVQFAAYPAVRLHIRWPGKDRVILFVEKEEALYRIIHDPTSWVNKMMLDSFAFR